MSTRYEKSIHSVNSVSKHDLCMGIDRDESANMLAQRVRRVVLQFHVVCHDDMGQNKYQLTCNEETSRASRIGSG